ncbi:MAG TPA: hypothetical protein VLE70_01595 [Anaerolineae bacterium]|nr:hypothetical protein [Anaerolineae bacterium]
MAEEEKSAFDQLYDKVEAAVADLTTLKVVTAVGDVNLSQEVVEKDGVKSQTHAETYQNAKAILSTIDLIDGDIMTVIDEVFINEGSYIPVRDDHLERIQSAQEIVEANVKLLKSLVDAVGDILTNIQTQSKTQGG